MSESPALTLTHFGGPTLLVEVAGWRILTDPTFDAPGKKYKFGWGTSSVKLAGPSVAPGDVGPLDAILVSHDHHDDNLDATGRTLLPTADVVVTTVSGRGRLVDDLGAGRVRGLADWDTTTLEAPGKPTITLTATPCRHGPPGSHPIVGDVIGFALSWAGQDGGVLWISGDTVLYDGVREVASRLTVDVAVVHVGGVRFPVSGPLRYTMTGADAVALIASVRPRVAIPIHYEGWTHFRDDRSHVEQAIAAAPADIQDRFRWLTIGEPTPVA